MFINSEQQSIQQLTPVSQTSCHFVQTTLYSRIKVVRERVVSLLGGWRTKVKSHRYQASSTGLDFYLEESLENTAEFYMTSQKPGVRKSDLIVIGDSSHATSYKILEISYYADIPDMWIARIAEV